MKNLISFRGGQGGVITRVALIVSVIISLVNPISVFAQSSTPTVTPGLGWCPASTPMPTQLSMEYYTRCGVCVSSARITPQIPINTFQTSNLLQSATPTVILPTVTPTLPAITWYANLNGPDQSHILPDQDYLTTQNYAGLTIYAAGTGKYNKVHIKNKSQWFLDPYYWDQWTHSNVTVHTMVCNSTKADIRLTKDDGTVKVIPNQPLNFEQMHCEDVYYKEWANYAQDFEWSGYIESFDTARVSDNKLVYMRNYVVNTRDSNSTYFTTWNYHIGNLPLATPTPYVDNWCGQYSYANTQEKLAGFSSIAITQGECSVILPEWTIHLDAVGETIPEINFSSPGISICPKWVDLGEFELAGIKFPSDILALPAVIFVLGLVFAL